MLALVKSTVSECEACKEVMDAESRFQKDNAGILAWITTTDQKQDHKDLRRNLRIHDVYRDCGKWLFENAEYCAWKEARDASKSVLWLSGTGRQP